MKQKFFTLFLALILLIIPGNSFSQEFDDRYKALQVLRIINYLNDEDPANAELCFIASNSVYQTIIKMNQSKSRLNFSNIKNFSDYSSEANPCQIIYISGKNGASTIKNLISRISPDKKGIVTISDIPQFLPSFGGMIYLFFDEERPKFSINLQKATDRKYKISSKLIEAADDTM